MSKLSGKVLTLPKMSGSVLKPKPLNGNVGAKTINIGEDGATFIPSVSADGVISWTNDKELPNPDPVNIKGEAGYTPQKGVDYFDGKDGSDATVTAANIKSALNYTPANQEEVNNISKEIVNLNENKQPKGDYALKNEIPSVPVQSVNGKTGAVSLSAQDVSADPVGTAETKISEHNISTAAHNDIRLLIDGLTTRLNALANSDDTTLDQMAEVVAYIKSNRTLIESITTDKISVADIVNNLTTNVSNKPLSAAQGVVLKGLIDALQTAVSDIKVPTKTSELTNDSGFLTQHQSLADYAKKTELPTKTSQLTNDSGFLTQHQDLSAYAKKTDIPSVPTKTSQLTNDSGFLTSVPTEYVTETELNAKGYLTQHQDLSAYAKTSQIPTKVSQLTNDKNYLTTVPSEYVTETELTGKGYATQTSVNNLSKEIGDETTARENAIADLNVKIGQQHLLFAEGDTVEDALEWLAENGDTTKVYVLPDGFFYEYKETIVESTGPTYTNLLPTAKDADRTTIYDGNGFKENYRLSSSGSESEKTGMSASGFIFPVKAGDVIRIKGIAGISGTSSYVCTYNSSNTLVKAQTFPQSGADFTTPTSGTKAGFFTYEGDTATYTLDSSLFGTGFDAIRFSGVFDENTIVTINQEITEGGGTSIVSTWASTGQAFVPTDYDEVIAGLVDTTDAHTKAIKELQENVVNGTPLEEDEKLELIREWDAPIYDAHIPVFELSAEKTAQTNATNTPTTIYAMYDALMAKYPRYITKTDLGLCSDGVNHIYRYDFREPEPYHQSNMPWSETKTKAILVSGIHYEWAGIYSLYYALEEIAENPSLYDLRRNTHFIVVPVINPYCTITSNYDASMGVLNANGVQIHRNFEVGFIYPNESGYVEAGNRNHGGTEPLSEVETQCLDNIFKENTDSAFFLTCHNFDSPSETNGLGFIWASSATKYMCNMGYRLVDKMTKAWLDKWGNELEAGIADYKTDNVTDDFIRLGFAHMSLTDGTETRQATKYGIQGNNVEICHTFFPHGTVENPEAKMSSFTLSRGAETYINFLITACGTYDYKDKEQYYK